MSLISKEPGTENVTIQIQNMEEEVVLVITMKMDLVALNHQYVDTVIHNVIRVVVSLSPLSQGAQSGFNP